MSRLIDLSGQRFGRLIAIKRVENGAGGNARWLCKCDCGNEKEILAESLRTGKVSSCGCYARECIEKRKKDMLGARFGKLVVVGIAPDRTKSGELKWECKCDCGKRTIVSGGSLRRGVTKSCGCSQKTHEQSKTRLYAVWSSMKRRCYSQSCREYQYYGGRGIKMCKDWKNDFSAFQQWAANSGYDETAKRGELTVDRIDTNGDYEPSNCRLVDMITQSRNRRSNRLITVDGKTLCATEWAEEIGVSPNTVFYWCSRGIEVERIRGIVGK